jgi:hypothetical protein
MNHPVDEWPPGAESDRAKYLEKGYRQLSEDKRALSNSKQHFKFWGGYV